MENFFDIKKVTQGMSSAPIPIVSDNSTITTENTPFKDISVSKEYLDDRTEYTIFDTPMCVPLRMKRVSQKETEYFLFPVEPLITIDGSNNVVIRNVAKVPVKSHRRGSIKERWAQNDYKIRIDGIMTTIGSSPKFPEEFQCKLMEFCESREAIDVICPAFERLGIHRIVITDWSLPFTKGPENQVYSINALSDDDWDLLVPLQEVKTPSRLTGNASKVNI